MIEIPWHVAEKAAMKTKGMVARVDSDSDLCFDAEHEDSCMGYITKDEDGIDQLNMFLVSDLRIIDLWRRFFINLIEMTGIPNVTGRSD